MAPLSTSRPIAVLTWMTLVACGGGGRADLTVRVRTDLVPGVDFVSMRAALSEGGLIERSAFLDGDWFTERQIGMFADLPRAEHTLEVRALDTSSATSGVRKD